MSVHMCVDQCAHVGMCVEVKDSIRHSFSGAAHLVFLKQGLLLAWSQPIRPVWWLVRPTNLPASALPALDYKHIQVCLTYMGSRDQLRSSCFQGEHFTDWAISCPVRDSLLTMTRRKFILIMNTRFGWDTAFQLIFHGRLAYMNFSLCC